MDDTAPASFAGLPRSLTGVVPGRTADGVRHLVQEAVLSGAVEPGSHLNAGALARHLGVSHIPVREALRWLEADGWVEHRPHLGAYVRPHNEDELADLFELRLTVEPAAARLAAERRTADQLAALTRIVDRQDGEADPVAFARINAEFHVSVAECSQNQWFVRVDTAVSHRARFYFRTVAPQRRSESLREHRQIIEALRRRDGASAEAIMHRHIAATWQTLDKVVRDSA